MPDENRADKIRELVNTVVSGTCLEIQMAARAVKKTAQNGRKNENPALENLVDALDMYSVIEGKLSGDVGEHGSIGRSVRGKQLQQQRHRIKETLNKITRACIIK